MGSAHLGKAGRERRLVGARLTPLRRRGGAPVSWSYRALPSCWYQQRLTLLLLLPSSEEEVVPSQHHSSCSPASLVSLRSETLLWRTTVVNMTVPTLCVHLAGFPSWMSLPGAFLSSIARSSSLDLPLVPPASMRKGSPPDNYKGQVIQMPILGQIDSLSQHSQASLLTQWLVATQLYLGSTKSSSEGTEVHLLL